MFSLYIAVLLRVIFIKSILDLLKGDYEDLELLVNAEKSSHVLVNEVCKSTFDGLFSLFKDTIADILQISEIHENINLMIVTHNHDLVNNSILSLHLGIWLWLKGRGMLMSEWKVRLPFITVTVSRLYDS